MIANLVQEFVKYGKHRRQLKRILNNTKASQWTHHLPDGSPSDTMLGAEDEARIKAIIENPVGIVIMGSKSWSKATIVNELLGYALLPVSPLAEEANNNWRTIRLMYGTQTQVSLAVANHYELVEHLAVYDRVWHQIPRSDLEMKEPNDSADPGYFSATLEIKLPHHLLVDDVQIIVAPSTRTHLSFESVFTDCFDGVSPIIIYALTDADSLNAHEVDDLMELKRLAPKSPVFFVRTHRHPLLYGDFTNASELTESQQHLLFKNQGLSPPFTPPSSCTSPVPFMESSRDLNSPLSQSLPLTASPSPLPGGPPSSQTLYQQLMSLGFLSHQRALSLQSVPQTDFAPRKSIKKKTRTTVDVSSELIESFENFGSILLFARHVLQSHLVEAADLLHAFHSRCLRMFILKAFDMTRDMMITPKRIDYAKQKEQALYESLMGIANRKQEEIKNLISDTLVLIREDLLEDAVKYQFKFSQKLNFKLEAGPRGSSPSQCTSRECSSPVQSAASSSSSNFSICSNCSRESTSSNSAKISAREYQVALTEVQDFVLSSLNAAIAGKLMGSVDILRDSYVGTLERCLSSLEKDNEEAGDSEAASRALKQIMNAAYQVEVNVKTTSSILKAFWEKMKQVCSSSLLWRHPPSIDREWKMKVASDVLDSLSEWRLAKSICAQFKERLRLSHDQFAGAMKNLESLHAGRLEKTEEQRIRVRKVYAPKIARCALESTSLRDIIIHGMPQLGREVGRGQYGVVYACDSWAGHSPVALKSVVPPDDKHWNDLAMEFYYTRSIPEHDRVVQIRGSVIDHSYGGGQTPAVLLIMDRLTRDLYTAIKNGLDWISRIQVAIDVVQGIRFLHSQGLVHRDIKLKNVLLDKKNRAKITDLGFCKPEAMMSGSIVGTPIHMAPELFSGRYDHSVDVYAFGILFWYICAGHVRLPYIFEQCQNKDQLWNCVRKGSRPERLPQFDDECWEIMEQCWAGDPSQRLLLGDVEPRLQGILDRYKTSRPPAGYTKNYMRSRGLTHTYHANHYHPHHRHQQQATIR